MPDSRTPLSGEQLLDAASDAILSLHVREHGYLPATAETVMLGEDLLACTMAGTYGDPGDPLADFGRTAELRRTDENLKRNADHTYVDIIQRLSGRTVLAFLLNYDAGPHRWVALFWLAPSTPKGPGASSVSTDGPR
ncbi:hypothetical protein DVA67_030910 [Solirubrobacter sp. CPCC 204708]|uniref:DUF2294 family protein n=1 Tax=Solirubrobacter deserti TaxID=2282478 RepID=A0ABT4RLF5_9ACTN|nr:hypothetical protein [Solirubrobacter deserti]MBE2320414.1 hypothetical protein [Solirubrobacter deserti]MDA0139395.1 hypothetical protein [Solirubrobacter deserti]